MVTMEVGGVGGRAARRLLNLARAGAVWRGDDDVEDDGEVDLMREPVILHVPLNDCR